MMRSSPALPGIIWLKCLFRSKFVEAANPPVLLQVTVVLQYTIPICVLLFLSVDFMARSTGQKYFYFYVYGEEVNTLHISFFSEFFSKFFLHITSENVAVLGLEGRTEVL